MPYTICHLCRAKVIVNSADDQPRCQKCGAKIPRRLLENLKDDDAHTDDYTKLACFNCLGRFTTHTLGVLNSCPHCGQRIVNQDAEALAKKLVGLEEIVLQRLLEGQSASAIVKEVMPNEVSSEAVWAFIDRLMTELPFERFREWGQRELKMATCCDTCGLETEKLTIYHLQWVINPEVLKQNRKLGISGFEGDFLDEANYKREALYCLCPQCVKKLKTPDFADGYPAKIGFELKSNKKLKDFCKA